MSTVEWGEQAHAATAASDWEVRHDQTSGAAYFFNVRMGESSWEAPTGVVVSAAESQQSAHEAAPVSEWVEAFDESSQRVYYVNLHTAETRWEPPPGYASVHAVIITGRSDKAEKEDPRMSTAEQMEKLNRLLSGDDDDEEEESGEQGGELHDVAQTPASGGSSHRHGEEQAPSTPSSDVTAAAAAVASPDMPWMMFLNESDGIPYYYNHVTSDCVWDPPDEFVAYHQLQEQQHSEEEGEGSHQKFAETEVEIAQRESARSGVEESPSACQHHGAASPSLPSSFEKPMMVTPEFEEKVRRAIESVSKTPIGSSRVVFVRTPSEKWPEFTKNGEDAVEDSERQLPPGTPSEATVDAFGTGKTVTPSTPGQLRSSRPGSAALSGASRSRTPRTMRIPEDAAAAGMIDQAQAHTGGERDPDTDTKTSTVSQANDEKGHVALVETPSSQLVESYDPETGIFRHVVGPLNLSDQHQEQEEQIIRPMESKFTVEALETDSLSAMAMQLRFEEAALVIECMVRCFLARHRVQKKRVAAAKERQELLAASGEIEGRQEGASAIDFHEANVEEQLNVVALDDSMETSTAMPPAALPVADQGTDFSVQEKEPMTPIDADAALPTEIPSIDETSLNSIEPTSERQSEVTSPPYQVGIPQSLETQGTLPDSASLKHESEESGASTPPPGLPATPSSKLSTSETIQEQQTEELDRATTPVNLTQTQDVRADGEWTPTEVVSSTPPMGTGGNPRGSTVDESRQKRASRPPSTASTVLTSRARASLLAPPYSPGVLDIAQYFQRPPLKAVLAATEREPADRESNSTAPPPFFIVRKRVDIPELKEQPAVSYTQATLVSTAERQARKEQQIQLVSAANARKRELVAQEMREFRQLYQESAEKYMFDKQQTLTALVEEKQRLKSDELRKVRPLSSLSLEEDNSRSSLNNSSSSRELLADITSAVSTTSRNSETPSFQTRVSHLLNPETFVEAMKSERFREIQQRLERLQTLNQVLETQLEAVDMCLLHEDHFKHDDRCTETNNATLKQTFQAKYASKLRRKQIELLRAIQFWEQQVANYNPSPQEPNGNGDGSAVVDGEDDRNPASSYWDRVHSYYTKAAKQSRSESIRLLRDANGDSLLHLAVWKGRQDDVAKLIQLSDDPGGMANLVDNTVSRTRPLHEACRGGHFEIVRLLVAAGAKLDAPDAMGDTPLHVACRLGWTRIVHFLLTVAEGDEGGSKTKIDEPKSGCSPAQPVTALSCSLLAFFNQRNHKKRRAMDLATLPSLIAFLQQYESELPHDPASHSDAQPKHAQQHRHKRHTHRSIRKQSKTGKL